MTPMDIYARNVERSLTKKIILQKRRKELYDKEMKECTFKPLLLPTKNISSSVVSTNCNSGIKRVVSIAQRKQMERKLAQLKRETLEQSKCTFQPKISPNTKKILQKKAQREEYISLLNKKNFKLSSSPTSSPSRPSRTPPSSRPSSAPQLPPPCPPSITLKELSTVIKCAWEGIVSLLRSYKRPKPNLDLSSNRNSILLILQKQILTSLPEINEMRNDDNDEYVRLQSRNASALHHHVNSQQVDTIDETRKYQKDIMMEDQKVRNILQLRHEKINEIRRKKNVVLQRLLGYYRSRIKLGGYSDEQSEHK